MVLELMAWTLVFVSVEASASTRSKPMATTYLAQLASAAAGDITHLGAGVNEEVLELKRW